MIATLLFWAMALAVLAGVFTGANVLWAASEQTREDYCKAVDRFKVALIIIVFVAICHLVLI